MLVGKIPFVPQAAKAVYKAAPYIAASEAINYARQNLPFGKYIPPGSEMIPWDMSFGKGGEAPKAPEPGAPLPEKPPPELLQSTSLATGPVKSGPEPSAGLGKLPVYPQEVAPSAVPRAQVSKALDTELRQAVGNQPVQPGVPMRLQGKGSVPAPGEVPTTEFAPATPSAVVKSYSYNPARQELTVTASNGIGYVHGEVSPQEAADFHAAPSKGQAWQVIQQNHVKVAKIVNGKRVAMNPSAFRSATPEDVAPGDMTPQLKESLRQALLRKQR
jgi:KTSC domain-containing protein